MSLYDFSQYLYSKIFVKFNLSHIIKEHNIYYRLIHLIDRSSRVDFSKIVSIVVITVKLKDF